MTTPLAKFDQMNLSAPTLRALQRAGYEIPSPVQAALIPPARRGRDCLGNAPTGTGKTAAFLLPLIEKIDDQIRRPQALVLAPTRELVHQIGREFERLAWFRRCRAVAIVGGEPMHRQRQELASGCQLILATPGRLIDVLERGWTRFDQVNSVVLDEADQMLDIGFRPAVEQILETVCTPRQTLLLSATMPRGVVELADRYLVDPVRIRLVADTKQATLPAVRQWYLMSRRDQKLELLSELLYREKPQRAIIFCRTKMKADELGQTLRQSGFSAEAMHGDLTQARRNRVLHSFRTGRRSLLVATDVVGRGIDVNDVTHVINFDIPDDAEAYIHRIGRTGRMGKDGSAYSIILPSEGHRLDQIERELKQQLEPVHFEGIDMPRRPTTRGRNGRPPAGRGSSPRRFDERRSFHAPKRSNGKAKRRFPARQHQGV